MERRAFITLIGGAAVAWARASLLDPAPGLPSCISLTPQLKREWSPWLEFGCDPGNRQAVWSPPTNIRMPLKTTRHAASDRGCSTCGRWLALFARALNSNPNTVGNYALLASAYALAGLSDKSRTLSAQPHAPDEGSRARTARCVLAQPRCGAISD
jgi:hypothetical protein